MATVLIIDDDVVILKAIEMLLAHAGYTTFTAVNGVDGLALCSQHQVDVVITDIIMPEKDGIETILEIRKKWPSTKIVAISGGGRIDAADYLSMAQKLGAHAVLAKPFRKPALLKTVEEVLR